MPNTNSMGNDKSFFIFQQVLFGKLSYNLGTEEAAILKLISGENKDALTHWEKLWSRINDYEELPFSCKELMPSAVKKIQLNHPEPIWAKNIPGHANFLSGLPRYTWTKNHYIIKQFQAIAAALEQEKIQFLALKGIGEMLDGNELSLMRTSRDIDLLIHEKDWLACEKIVSTLGWEQKRYVQPLHTRLVKNPFKRHAVNFQNKAGVFDLDIHFTVISGFKLASEGFTNSLWKRKVRSKNFPNLFIPCISDRLIISVANAMSLQNWVRNHATKYLFDIFAISQRMNQEQLEKAIEDGEFDLKIGKQIAHLLDVANDIQNKPSEIRKINQVYAFNKSISKGMLMHLIRIQNLILLIRIIIKHGDTFKYIRFIGYLIGYRIFIGLPLSVLEYLRFKTQQNIAESINNQQFSIHLFSKSKN